jgi:hypothetical protein
MSELIPNIRFQVGKGSLHIIHVDEISEREEGSDCNLCDLYQSGFQIAHLDAKGNIIAGNVLAFEDENAPKIARLLAMAMWDIAKGTIGLPFELKEYSLIIELLNKNGIRISRNNTGVIVHNEDIAELGGRLAVTVGSTPYRSAKGIQKK